MSDVTALVEKVARALAVADGYDPEEIVGGGPDDFKMRSADFTGHLTYAKSAAWKRYIRHANLYIAAQRAMGSIDV